MMFSTKLAVVALCSMAALAAGAGDLRAHTDTSSSATSARSAKEINELARKVIGSSTASGASGQKSSRPEVLLMSRVHQTPADWAKNVRDTVPTWARALGAMGIVLIFVGAISACAKADGTKSSQKIDDAECQSLEVEKIQLQDQVDSLTTQIDNMEKMMREEQQEAERVMLKLQRARDGEEVEVEGEKTEQDLRDDAEGAAMAAEIVILQKAMEGYKALNPVLVKKAKVESIVRSGTQRIMDRAQNLAVNSVSKALEEVQNTVGVELPMSSEKLAGVVKELSQGGNVMGATLQAAEPPPLSVLISGLFAPMQLQGLASGNQLQLFLAMPCLLIMVAAISIDLGLSCAGGDMWVWILVSASVNTAVVALRLGVALSVGKTQMKIRMMHEADRFVETDNPAWNLRQRLSIAAKEFFSALFHYDAIVGGKSYCILNFTTLINFIWGAVGVWLSVHYIVPDEEKCDAWAIMTVTHIMCFLYVVFFTFTLVGLVLWAVQTVATNSAMAKWMFKKAQKFDEMYSPGSFPFYQILVRAFLFRDSSNTASVEVSVLQSDISDLSQRKQDLSWKTSDLDREIKKLEDELKSCEQDVNTMSARREALDAAKDKYVKRYNESWDKAAEQAKPQIELLQETAEIAGQEAKQFVTVAKTQIENFDYEAAAKHAREQMEAMRVQAEAGAQSAQQQMEGLRSK